MKFSDSEAGGRNKKESWPHPVTVQLINSSGGRPILMGMSDHCSSPEPLGQDGAKQGAGCL